MTKAGKAQLPGQEGEDPVAEQVELVDPVHAFPDQHHPRIPHHPPQRFEIVVGLGSRIKGVEAPGVVTKPLNDACVRSRLRYGHVPSLGPGCRPGRMLTGYCTVRWVP